MSKKKIDHNKTSEEIEKEIVRLAESTGLLKFLLWLGEQDITLYGKVSNYYDKYNKIKK